MEADFPRFSPALAVALFWGTTTPLPSCMKLFATVFLQVDNRSLEAKNIVSKVPKCPITITAEKSSNFTCTVIVVYCQRTYAARMIFAFRLGAPTDRTQSLLGVVKTLIVLWCEAVLLL